MKIRLALLGVGVGGVTVFGVWTKFFGEAEVHLVVPHGRTAQLIANGQELTPTSAYGMRQSYSLAQGDYTFRVKSGDGGTERTYTLKLHSGFDSYVLPLDDKQCFTRLDVTGWYGHEGEALKTQVKDRISAEAPFPKYNDWLDRQELPKQVKSRTDVRLLAPVACDALKGNDGQLLSELGI